MSAGVEYTIDQLAREAGTTVRSLRVYHERGVLPPPTLKGRTGFYGPEHLNRVHTISRLLDRGIKLNGIKELLNAWDRGDGLGEVLGEMAPGAPAPQESVESQKLSATELADRYADVPNGLARVVAAGMYEPVDAATYRVIDPQLIRIVDQFVSAGIPLDEAVSELERLRIDCDRIARRFVDVFQRTTRDPHLEDTNLAARAAHSEQLSIARALPGRATSDLINRFVARYLEEEIKLTDA
ncbi:MerR family transcriptional regulator [Nocardia sp. CDC160]|uniref:MerR family transcriptional regulator n=1 Tax=Nocardia sp. CDC160 TaxID=3112166 RepID=UPI002DC0516C|nr:MerR family transcriptional regulator [Nocardia sp. CDC160]MEC3920236.1 MerR family transcriptional regulator [Nocardia sp. CDC160]